MNVFTAIGAGFPSCCGYDNSETLADANEANEGEPLKITAKSLKAALRKVGQSPDDADERNALEAYSDLLEQHAETKAKRKAAQEDLDKKIDAKYPKLTEAEIKTLVVDDKWMARLQAAVQGELDRVSQTLIQSTFHYLCEPVALPREVEQFLHHFCGDAANANALTETEALRVSFYKSVAIFARAYSDLAQDLTEAGYSDAEAAAL